MLKFVIAIILLLTNYTAISLTRCSFASGTVKCPDDIEQVANVQIDLYDDDDLPLDSHDLMGRTWTNKKGQFEVTGCGSDFGPINTPDPFLYITHNCRNRYTNETHPIEIDLIPIFLPLKIRLGNIYLDRYLDQP